MADLTHLDPNGQARMVDVGHKSDSHRRAVARGHVKLSPEALAQIAEGRAEKGDVLATARIAGIMAAKKTPDLIPLCHLVALSSVTVELEPDPIAGEIRITAETRAHDRTGVEMEALTAVSVAALTLYDMLKSVDRDMQIGGIELIEKEGGQSGHWQRPLKVVRKTPQIPEPAPVRTRAVPRVPLPESVPPRPVPPTGEMPALQVIEAIATPPLPRARPNSKGPADRAVSAVARERARRVRLVSSDEPALMALLRTSPIDVAYMLGDLDVPYAEHCRWYAVDDGRLGGVLLHYNGLSMPTVLTHGSAIDVEALLLATNTDLPRRFYGHFHPEHRAAFEAFFDLGTPRPMKRMGLARAAYHRQGDFAEVEPLSHRDTGAIMRLYQHYPDNFFEPAQLDTGLYFGIRDGDELISVAGIHVLSERHDIAAIGNIVTHSGHRGRGLATRCVGRLLDALFHKVGAVALNVQEGNEPAIRCYRKFGFADRYDFWEGVAQAR